ncbi:MAG: hypothetical protein U5J63_05570 [Fodinibius sp.]|nr:hypothetical protein [Fodinibius sp.]
MVRLLPGTNVSVQAEPAQGWLFEGWSGDTTGSGNPLELVMNKDYQLSANFSKQIFHLTTAVDPVEGGQVSPESDNFEYGTDVDVRARPAKGWQFTSWAGDTTISANPVTVTVDKDYSLTAIMEKEF